VIARIVSTTPVPGVRAGSALLTVAERLLVVGDDAHAVTWISLATGDATPQVLAGDGLALPKAHKPDLEAAAVADDGSVWIIGSGSLRTRSTAYRLSGPDHTNVTSYDVAPVHAALAALLPEPPNVEGMLLVDGVLRLFHRATGVNPDLVVDLPADSLSGGSVTVLGSREITAPKAGGVRSHVTDAAVDASGRVVLLAAAEDTPDAVADGPVTGCLIGWLDGEWTPILEADGTPTVRKAEGMVLDADGTGGWLVTDRDDPSLPAELCRFTLR
jgi:hypothetical protein